MEEEEEGGKGLGPRSVTPDIVVSGKGDVSVDVEVTAAAAVGVGVGVGSKTALSEMAGRESHRKHPDAMIDEVKQENVEVGGRGIG